MMLVLDLDRTLEPEQLPFVSAFYTSLFTLAIISNDATNMYKVAASVRLCVCVPYFGKNVRTDFHETFHGSYGSYVDLNGKKSGKFQPLMCKISENGAKLPISRKSCG